MSLMPDTPLDWFELAGLFFGVLVLTFVGWAVVVLFGMWADRRRAAKKPPQGLSWESQLAADTPAPASKPRRRSPYAPKQQEAK